MRKKGWKKNLAQVSSLKGKSVCGLSSSFISIIFNKNSSTTEWVVKVWSYGSSCILGRILSIFKPTQSWQDNPNPKGLPMYPLLLNQRLRVWQLKASQQQIITSLVLFIWLNFCHTCENPSWKQGVAIEGWFSDIGTSWIFKVLASKKIKLEWKVSGVAYACGGWCKEERV